MSACFDFDVITDPASRLPAPKPAAEPRLAEAAPPAAVANSAIPRHKAD
jgi:hypothetical protein